MYDVLAMNKIAVVCAPGIGDALILHIASYQLKLHGFEVTTFTDHRFGNWLAGYSFEMQPELDRIEECFANFDAIFLQHDNSPKAKKIYSLSKPVYTFYGSHLASKHGPLKSGYDFVCNPDQTMVENVATSLKKLFHLGDVGKENGLTPPAGLIHRKFANRVLIHTTSGKEEKCWPKPKFLEVAEELWKAGFETSFLPQCPSLESLASMIYETGFFLGNDSGPGHFASYFQIPHLIIGKTEKEMRLWRPGWKAGEIVYPPNWIPNWKGFRLRENHWRTFISAKNVVKRFKKNVLCY